MTKPWSLLVTAAGAGRSGTDFPDAATTVVGNQKCSIARDSHTNRTAPRRDLRSIRAIAGKEAGQEVFQRSRSSVVHREEDHLVPCGHLSIPRTMQRNET